MKAEFLFPSFIPISHAATYRSRHTKTDRDALKLRCRKWRWRDCPLRLLHYPFFVCSLFILWSHSDLTLPLCGFFYLRFAFPPPQPFFRCVHLFPVLGVLSLVIFSPVPHLSAIIKDPAETKVCISATHLATDPRNYGL